MPHVEQIIIIVFRLYFPAICKHAAGTINRFQALLWVFKLLFLVIIKVYSAGIDPSIWLVTK